MYWRYCPQEFMREFVDALTVDGMAVMFGRTRDGGALSLLVLAGDDKLREYIASPGDIIGTMLAVLEELGYPELVAKLEKSDGGFSELPGAPESDPPVPIRQPRGSKSS
jgi:hypothetical protein